LKCNAIGEEEEQEKAKVCYARVSSAHQRQDLERQVEDLRQAFLENEIVQDVGSGLNWKRPGFKALLERGLKGHVAEVVVAHRDRLCRFAFALVEQIFRHHRVKLVVLDTYASPESEELSEDLLAITTVFVARHNGQRSVANQKKRKRAELEQEAQETEEEETQAE
jgi:predicted site-specific integrase-resolvase